jgi:hypothetical protein
MAPLSVLNLFDLNGRSAEKIQMQHRFCHAFDCLGTITTRMIGAHISNMNALGPRLNIDFLHCTALL